MNIRQLLDERHRPFASHPRVDRYFPAAAIEDARGRLTRSIQRGDGPGVVIGSAGTGKSLLLQVLAAQYQDQFDVVLLACSQICTRRALLQAVLFELGLPYHQRDEGELRLTLLEHLLSDQQSPDGLLLLVDEAQTLSVVLLEELRMMTNLVRGGAPRVRLVLAGSPALEETFAAPELESFSQRLAARCYLGPLGRDDTIQYVRAQLAASGADPDAVFAPEAWVAIVEATDGVPRLVNQLCDRALLVADAKGRPLVDRQTIQMAWADMQQLPTPWDTHSARAPDETQQVVEFGSLNDSADALFETDGQEASAELVAAVEDADEEPFRETSSDHHASIEIAAAIVQPKAEKNKDLPAATSSLPVTDDVSEELCVADAVRLEQQSGAGPWGSGGPHVYAADAGQSANPFDEPFDEEEIVLDNFAAWDDMTLSDMPRVENLCDPQFAMRVQEALNASAASTQDGCSAGVAQSGRASAPQGDQLPTAAAAVAGRDDAADGEPTEQADDKWPPLRLAIVSEAATLHPVPLIKSSGEAVVTAAAAFDPVMPEENPADFRNDEAAYAVSCVPAGVAVRSEAAVVGAGCPEAVDDPILIVEEDPDEAARSMPPVRREEYRQLFSRLRGG